jgi:hypothetical protein
MSMMEVRCWLDKQSSSSVILLFIAYGAVFFKIKEPFENHALSDEWDSRKITHEHLELVL